MAVGNKGGHYHDHSTDLQLAASPPPAELPTGCPGSAAPRPSRVFTSLSNPSDPVDGADQLTDKSDKFDGWTQAMTGDPLFRAIRTRLLSPHGCVRMLKAQLTGLDQSPAVGTIDCPRSDRVQSAPSISR